MIVTVTHADKSKQGKDRVYFGGKNHWKDAYYVGANCPVPQVGATIEADTSSKQFNGAPSPTYFLNGWKIRTNGSPQQESPKIQIPPHEGGWAKTVVTGQPIIPTHDGWEIPGMNAAQLVSNVLATAITAGLIKYPGDLGAWSNAAQRALQRLRDGKFEAQDLVNGSYTEQGPDPTGDQGHPDFEDDIPF
jgi:hypothetical protein